MKTLQVNYFLPCGIAIDTELIQNRMEITNEKIGRKARQNVVVYHFAYSFLFWYSCASEFSI